MSSCIEFFFLQKKRPHLSKNIFELRATVIKLLKRQHNKATIQTLTNPDNMTSSNIFL